MFMCELVEVGCFVCMLVILFGVGLVWYDVVVEEFWKVFDVGFVEVVLCLGCYLMYDVGIYKKV